MILDREDLERGEIDQGVQAFDRMSIVIVEREGAHPDEAVEDAPPAFDFVAEIADRPWIDAHEVELFEKPAALQGRLKAGIRPDGALDVEDFFDRHHGARGLVETLAHDRARSRDRSGLARPRHGRA